jgi:hypothetical protein
MEAEPTHEVLVETRPNDYGHDDREERRRDGEADPVSEPQHQERGRRQKESDGPGKRGSSQLRV